jgi:hypothetical protein
MKLPQRYQDTKKHKELMFKDLILVQLSRLIGTSSAIVVWWQKSTFQSNLNIPFPKQ